MSHTVDFRDVRALIVGDVMLDRYWQGKVHRISPEAPVPVVNVGADERRLGGAANVAANITALGGQAILLGQYGQDESGDIFSQLLKEHGVQNACLTRDDIPTTQKLRVLSSSQQMIRMDFEEAKPPSTPELLARFQRYLPEVDIVILSDYAKGMLKEAKTLIQAAKTHNVPVLVDPKSTDYECYRGATVITPNRQEFQQVTGCVNDQEMTQAAEYLTQQFDIANLLVTLSEQGMVWYPSGQEPLRCAAVSKEVFDVTGAGDTVLASIALGWVKKWAVPDIMRFANQAAGVVVQKVGTAQASLKEIMSDPNVSDKIQTADDLATIVDSLRTKGHRIVFTNGCFDVMHVGHVRCLHAAKSAGDILIVAVNDDASIARLKGPSRPVNPLAARQEVMAAIGAVDYVTAFSEDTPLNIIKKLLPDVLVKGGDYCIESIVGADIVMSRGGEVLVFPIVDGFSTTSILKHEETLSS